MKAQNALVLLFLAVPAAVMVGGGRFDHDGPDSRALSVVSWWRGEPVVQSRMDTSADGECDGEPCEEVGEENGDDAESSGSDGPLLHGDTSVPDEELKKFYGDKIPDERFLLAQCKKMPPVKFNHRKHVEMKIACCGNCHHKEPKEIKSCAQCHVYTPQEQKDIKYQKAHHGLCQRCHKANKKGKEGPPIKCKDCHRSENTAASKSQCPLPKEGGK